MRIINKKYSMESFISRLPGVYPAYKDGELYYFDEVSLNSRGHEFPTNYGMIPLNLVLTKNPTDITNDDDVNIISPNGNFIMSWSTLSDWYSFFKNYYSLLKDNGNCNAIYSSATEYYDTEMSGSSTGKFTSELKYGTERSTYENFDSLFNERGGKVSVLKNGNCITGVTDVGFYGWVNKCIISGSTNHNITVNPNSSEKFIPKIDDNINLSVSIDDIGEFSIFSKEYEFGESYTSGETIYKDNKSMYISAGTGYDYDDVTMEMVIKDTDWGDYTNYFISKNPMYTPVTSTTVSGHTTSKLDSLCSKDCLIDDIGNKINGKYSPDVTYDNSKRYIIAGDSNSQPSEGEELELLYQVGNVGNIYPFEMNGETYFIGDIITDMYFYYEDISGEKYTGDNSGSSLQRINSIEGIPSGTTLITENVLCNITYCVGATLKKDEDDVLHIYGNNSGITYYETVEFEKHNEEYHLKVENKKTTPVQKKDPSNHSVSYPVVCYRIKKKETEIDGENKYIDNLAEFKMETSGTNGMTIFPVLRQEYMFGSATMQNVDADIYIDRGINAAIDKHLKLGEVTSMEALENYSNGYFKIMDN